MDEPRTLRHRAVGVVLHDGRLLCMGRSNARGAYYTFPGGGIEPGEGIQAAVLRELAEETSITATIDRPLYEIRYDTGDVHYYYLCRYQSGEPQLHKDSEEYASNLRGEDLYSPQWVGIDQLDSVTLYPVEAAARLITDLRDGFDKDTVTIPAKAPRFWITQPPADN